MNFQLKKNKNGLKQNSLTRLALSNVDVNQILTANFVRLHL